MCNYERIEVTRAVVFSSLVFLFIFLPITIAVYYVVPLQIKNVILLIASLLFYAWGEPIYIFLMLLSIVINYGFGIAIDQVKQKLTLRKTLLTGAIISNLLILGYYKYSDFFISNINTLFKTHIPLTELPLPIGISFFTFQALSYVIDVYRRDVAVQKNVFNLALYISLFPQLIAGPIVRYNTIAEQIGRRTHKLDLFASGVKQFILGLAKKVLIANQLGEVADYIFALEAGSMSVGTAWIGMFAYALQIYFDFSGYSDMAIGLGKMFGFEFLRNFNYPYIARSISEFWRRWHISLSTWFRDYVYIPLGGNRGPTWKTYRNLLIVWTITGFWHGASWTFMAWGFYYGLLISIERLGLLSFLEKLWRPVQHLYMIVLVSLGWVFFRADNFAYSIEYLKTMFGLNKVALVDPTALLYAYDYAIVFVVAIIFSMPVFPYVKEKLEIIAEKSQVVTVFQYSLSPIIYMSLLFVVTMFLVNSTYNPFIYFRF